MIYGVTEPESWNVEPDPPEECKCNALLRGKDRDECGMEKGIMTPCLCYCHNPFEPTDNQEIERAELEIRGMNSQVQIVGQQPPKTWDDYERGCLATFGGGHKTTETIEAFRHGMQTVFNLLRHEFPPAEQFRIDNPIDSCVPDAFGLCKTHDTCGHVKESLRRSHEELAAVCGDDAEWRIKLRDFASDSEQHNIKRSEWKEQRDSIESITLYAHGGFFTAYFDDANAIWEMSDDDLPMFHVMIKSDPPHRTCIHPIHLVAWLNHMAETIIPVRIMGRWDV